ncbi:MAG: rod shape-determining protein MreC [Candidatus Aminicenantes bacterium]|nr:rod shape-determining protein MreC [Candidatus Aminicenantes bacterium]
MPLLPREKKSIRIFAGLVVLQIVLISFQVPLGSRPSVIEKAVFTVLTPVQHGGSAVFRFLGRLWRVYVYHVQIERQNQDLRRESFMLRQENAGLRRDVERYRSAEEMRASLSRARKRVRIASVVSLDPLTYKSSLVIDRGRNAGVKKDMVVLDRFGSLVGRVVEPVSPTEAAVQLITDEASGVGVVIAGDKGVGVLSGDGTGACRLKYILSTMKGIVPGDEVFTSGFDGIFPPGLHVGRVVSVGSDEGLFKSLRVQPQFRFRDLGRLAVLLQDGEEVDREGRGGR